MSSSSSSSSSLFWSFFFLFFYFEKRKNGTDRRTMMTQAQKGQIVHPPTRERRCFKGRLATRCHTRGAAFVAASLNPLPFLPRCSSLVGRTAQNSTAQETRSFDLFFLSFFLRGWGGINQSPSSASSAFSCRGYPLLRLRLRLKLSAELFAVFSTFTVCVTEQEEDEGERRGRGGEGVKASLLPSSTSNNEDTHTHDKRYGKNKRHVLPLNPLLLFLHPPS